MNYLQMIIDMIIASALAGLFIFPTYALTARPKKFYIPIGLLSLALVFSPWARYFVASFSFERIGHLMVSLGLTLILATLLLLVSSRSAERQQASFKYISAAFIAAGLFFLGSGAFIFLEYFVA